MGGRGLDWYQPLHENGNALSYPQRISGDDGPVPIADLGTFLLAGRHRAEEAGARQARLRAGSPPRRRSTSRSASRPAVARAPRPRRRCPRASTSRTARTSASAASSSPGRPWRTTSISSSSPARAGAASTPSKNSAESASGFTLARESGVKGSQAYNAATAYYSSDAGVMKVAHAVDLAGNAGGMQWWSEQSSPAPDPALNLPFRIDMTKNESTGVLDVPAWSDSPGHQRLRQFFVVHPADPSKPLVSEAPLTSRRSPARRSSSRSGSTTTASARARRTSWRSSSPFPSTIGRASRRATRWRSARRR